MIGKPQYNILVNTELSYSNLIQAIFVNYFEQVIVHNQIPTPNQKHRIHRLSIPNIKKDFILKEYLVPKCYSIGRRLELLIHMYFKNYALSAYHAALKLQGIGIDTFVPVACWQTGNAFQRCAYLLMEELPNDGTLKHYYLSHQKHGCNNNEQLIKLLKQAGTIVRHIHECGFIHGDITLNNFLLHNLDSGQPKLYLVDLERFQTSKDLSKIKKKQSLPESFARLELNKVLYDEFIGGYNVNM